jgi:hypothetical protein
VETTFKLKINITRNPLNQGCGSGLIQSGSGNLAQSGSTMSLNPDPIRIHNSTLEDKFLQADSFLIKNIFPRAKK